MAGFYFLWQHLTSPPSFASSVSRGSWRIGLEAGQTEDTPTDRHTGFCVALASTRVPG